MCIRLKDRAGSLQRVILYNPDPRFFFSRPDRIRDVSTKLSISVEYEIIFKVYFFNVINYISNFY